MDFKIVLLSSLGNQILLPLLENLNTRNIPVQAVIIDGTLSDKDKKIQEERTRGFFKGQDISEIEKYEVPLFFVKNHNGERCESLLKKLAPNILVNAGTPRILKENIISIPLLGTVNSHPGLLPQYRGCTCVEWALYNNDEVGASCHFIDKGIDTGPIIYKEVIPIKKGDLYEEIRAKMIFHSMKVLAEGILKIRNENISYSSLLPQEEGGYYKVIPKDKILEIKERLKNNLYKHYSQ